ncbi:malectin [Phlebotomus argentipes]|uniref:malectin n=1 Tax=Phlebotomus argentipes TaxID=94469 RepID=UPI00289345D9|nr:malectin [Phlebotomus argentipes]
MQLQLRLLGFLLLLTGVRAYDVIYALNAGGESHSDRHGITYERDPLMGKVGTASDYGKNIHMIARIADADKILYQTERYHTSNFGYDIPLAGDGEYVLVLKFSEVYFNAPNMKVFDVVLNGEHTVVSDLDIFQQVGRGTAHDEYVYFSVSRDRLYYKEDESEIRDNRVRVEFIKGFRDNPKINALALLKGDLEGIPTLPRQMVDPDADFFAAPDPVKPSSMDSSSRVRSGPPQPNPYFMDDSSMMLLPIFIAIGAFFPLLFCLCKL